MTRSGRTKVGSYSRQLSDGREIPTIIESDNEQERCPYCGNWYSKIANHWSHPQSDCQWPPISNYKMELLTGMMLGDGSMNTANGHFECGMINKTFLEWLSTELGWLVNGISIDKTAVKMAKECNGSFGSDTKPSNCSDYYRMYTRTHPDFQQFIDWYNGGKITYPNDVKLKPTILRMWYVSDGGLNWSHNGAMIQFTSCNEANRPKVIRNMLNNIGFTVNHSKGDKSFYIPYREIDQFFDYMGHNPVPGFEYKWSYKKQSQYDILKKEMRERHCTQTLENE
jgi:hypothetical protein